MSKNEFLKKVLRKKTRFFGLDHNAVNAKIIILKVLLNFLKSIFKRV
jgi:hypothetical protein